MVDPNNVRCEICENEEATVRCSECSQFLGAVCTAAHKKMKVSSRHSLIPLDDYFSDKVSAKRTTHCLRHPHLEVDAYCTNCNVSLCSKCAVDSHSSHSFRPLMKMAEDMQEDITAMLLQASLKKAEAESSISKSHATIEGLQKDIPISETNIRRAFANLREILEKREAELLGQLYDRTEKAEKVARTEQDEAEFVHAELKGFCEYGCSLLAEGTPAEIASSYKKVCLFSLNFVRHMRPKLSLCFFFFFSDTSEVNHFGAAVLSKPRFGECRPDVCSQKFERSRVCDFVSRCLEI